MEQLYVIKKSMAEFRSQNVTPNNVIQIKEEIRYLRNENITKTCIIKSLTENQATGHGKAATTPKVKQQDAAIQTEVTPKTWPQEEINLQNSHDTSKSLPNANVGKSGNNSLLRQNKENVKKKTLIVGDSIVKDIARWCLKKRTRSTVSVRSIPGTTTKGMIHPVKGCLEDTSPDFMILHHGTNDLNSKSTSEEIADKILNLATSIKTSKNQLFASGLVIMKDKLNKKDNEVNELLKNKCEIRKLSFFDNKTISLGMLNSGIHLNENGTTRLVNNFCYNMNALQDETCMGTRNKTEKEESAIAKTVNKNFVFNENSSNTDRSVNPTIDNNKSLSRNNSAEERAENDVFPSVPTYRFQNAKNVTIDALSVNSLRNKIGAVQELITNNIDICLLSETEIDETFLNQQFNVSNYQTFRRGRNKNGAGL